MHRLNHILFVLCLLGVAAPLTAQSGANSPYSRFGIGDIQDNNFVASRMMGGMGATFVDPYYLNIVNPASYAHLKSTAFEVGLYARRSNLAEGDNTTQQWSGNLQYLSLGFPLTNPINEVIEGKKKDYYLGMSFTLMPHSTVAYNVFSQNEDPEIGEYTQNYRGEGGSYKFLWGNSIQYKEFSFGINLGYLFGKLEYTRNTFFTDKIGAQYNNFITDYKVNGFLWNAGFMYDKVLNQKEVEENKAVRPRKLTLGIYGNSNTGFSTDATANLITILAAAPSSTPDTAFTILPNDGKGDGTLPAQFGVGAMYQKMGNYGIGFNYQTTRWNSYKNDAENITNSRPIKLTNTYKANIGGYIRPSSKNYGNYFKRVKYRWGVYYQTDPRNDESSNNVSNYGLSMGMSMPFYFQRKISHANIGVDLGRRGSGSAIEEKYVQINFSFTYNDDEWFLKRRYN